MKFKESKSIYLQIADRINDEILQGQYAEEGRIPVSYTHLDVYKRQGGGTDSMALSQGISEALINTAFGILTGALAVIAYNYYTCLLYTSRCV